MIYLIQNDREYDYDVRAIALAFYERTKIVEVTKEEFEEQEWEKDDLLLTLVYTKKRIQGWLKGKVGIEGTEERAVSEDNFNTLSLLQCQVPHSFNQLVSATQISV